MFRFNVPRTPTHHVEQAVNSAVEIAREFDRIKKGWLNFGLPGERIFTRSGIAYGPLHEAIVGHPQSHQLTVLGEPVNMASYLCELGDRTRNALLIDDSCRRVIEGSFPMKEITLSGKNGGVKLKCYEIATEVVR
jgi:class 3 adenylate cyclase